MFTPKLSLLFALTLVACGPTAVAAPDGGIVLPDAAAMPDSPMAAPDAGPTPFGRCTTSDDCPASAPVCNRLYPGGVCTTVCATDADCTGGGCWANFCAPGCTLGTNDCAPYGGNCYDNYPAGDDYCIGACYPESTTAPSGWPTCGSDAHCNPWGDFCDPASAPLPTGGENGAPCASYADCKSQLCFTTAQGPFIDGECLSYGRQVAASAFVNGQPLPQSNCPPGSVVGLGDWLSFGFEEGDSAFCFPSCTADSDCRVGYACGGLVDEGDGRHFATGVCLPIHDCMTNPAHPCPTGHTCVVNTSSTEFSHCQ